MVDEKTLYVTKPTRAVLLMRTFVPFQLRRFVVINLRMIGIVRRGHRTGGRG